MLATKRRQPVNKVANSPGREEEEEGVFVRLFSSRIFALPILAVPSFWASPSSSSSSLGPARVALTRRRDFHTIVCIETNRSREPRGIHDSPLLFTRPPLLSERQRKRGVERSFEFLLHGFAYVNLD